MSRKLTALFVAAALFSSLTAATTVFAEEANPSPQGPSAQGMMGDHGGMMNMMGQMSPDHMKQMSRMVENCNRMMESMNHTPNQQPAPDTQQ
jgi:Spy/CpxP family protein refolding chaperone